MNRYKADVARQHNIGVKDHLAVSADYSHDTKFNNSRILVLSVSTGSLKIMYFMLPSHICNAYAKNQVFSVTAHSFTYKKFSAFLMMDHYIF